MTQNQLSKLTHEWQRRLRLQDWNVDIKSVTENEMENDQALGEISFVINRKIAHIQILSQEIIEGSGESLEMVIVHELLHIHMAGWQQLIPESAHEMMYWTVEQAIDSIARAFVNQ